MEFLMIAAFFVYVIANCFDMHDKKIKNLENQINNLNEHDWR